MTSQYSFKRRGRTPSTAYVLAGVYAAIALAIVVFDLSQWIALVLVLFTLPAVWDLYADPRSGMTISTDRIEWFHGKNSAKIETSVIKRVVINLRLDRSVKLGIELHNGKRIRVTQPSIPPLKHLERELSEAKIPFQKNPFSLL